MKISFVLPGFARRPGGGHKVVYQYANFLADKGHEVAIAHFRPAERREKASTLNNLALDVGYWLNSSRRPEWFPLDNRVRVVNHGQPSSRLLPTTDVLVATSVETAEFVFRCAEQSGASPFYFLQHYETFSTPRARVDETWQYPMTRIVVSEWLRSIGDSMGVQTILVPNGIDRTEFPIGRPWSQRPNMILGLVSEQRWKRTDLFVEAAERLRLLYPGLTVAAFGVAKSPPNLPEWIEYYSHPSRERLSELYREARIYLCCSDSEGFGLPIAEAMSSGTAVVSTRNGGIEAFAGNAILYAPVGDVDAIVAQASRLISQPGLAPALLEEAERRLIDYDLLAAAEKFEEALLTAHPGGGLRA